MFTINNNKLPYFSRLLTILHDQREENHKQNPTQRWKTKKGIGVGLIDIIIEASGQKELQDWWNEKKESLQIDNYISKLRKQSVFLHKKIGKYYQTQVDYFSAVTSIKKTLETIRPIPNFLNDKTCRKILDDFKKDKVVCDIIDISEMEKLIVLKNYSGFFADILYHIASNKFQPNFVIHTLDEQNKSIGNI